MRARNGGFTLVEILIVVVILGILAAIVIPQFTQASNEARESSLVSNLQTMRSQIELYKIQHKDTPPDAATFVAQMTGYTDIDGAAAAAPGVGVYGPYLQKVPANPFNNLNTIAAKAHAAGDNTTGWQYDESTGAIHANDDETCPDAVDTPHSSL